MEVGVESFGDEGHLSVAAEVLVTFAERFEY